MATRTDSDNFDRADVNPINSYAKAEWYPMLAGANCKIVGNRVQAVSTGGGGCAMRFGLPFPANHTSSVKFVTCTGGGGQARACARMSATADTYYLTIVGAFGTTLPEISKYVAGSYTSLGTTSSGTVASGTKVSCDCSGTTIRALLDGVQKHSVTDSSIASGFPGLGVFATSNLADAEIDDFEATCTQFPVLYDSAKTDGVTATATPVINIPTAARLDTLMLAMIRVAVGGTIGWPAGWNKIVDASPDGADDQISIAWKQSLGDVIEGTTATLSCTSAKFSSVVYEIYGVTMTAPALSTVAIGTNTTPDPTTVTPTGGSADYLIIWAGSWEGEQTSPPAAAPTNYSGMIAANSGTGGAVTTNTQCVFAWREVTGASEDPGSLTISVADDWSAYAIAIYPAFTTPRPPTVILNAVPHSVNW